MKIVDQQQGLCSQPVLAPTSAPASRDDSCNSLRQPLHSDSVRGGKRTSPDPLSRTDRYRLVTPFKPQL